MEDFERINTLWLEKLRLAHDRKEKEFGKYARECWNYYAGPHDFMYKGGDGELELSNWGLPGDCPMITVNKSFEMVDVFLPYMHHRNPTRLMSARQPKVDPMLKLAVMDPAIVQQIVGELTMQQVQANPAIMADPMAMQQMQQQLLQQYLSAGETKRNELWTLRRQLMEPVLNYTPQEFGLHHESRKSLTEALITGRGVWWITMCEGAHGTLPMAEHVPVEDVLVDPDFYTTRDWKWVARRRRSTAYEFSKEWEIPKEELLCNDETSARTANVNVAGNQDRMTGASHDLVIYWEIYSRCGIGAYLKGADEELESRITARNPNVKLIVSEALKEPANLRSEYLNLPDADRVDARQTTLDGLAWDIPWWMDYSHPWPFVFCDFHHQKDSAWPVSHLRPALGEQKMLNWIWSHVASRVKKSSYGKWLYRDDLDSDTLDDLKRAHDALYVPVRVKAGEKMDSVAYFLQGGELPKDLFEVGAIFERMFEMRTGVSELLSMGSQPRQMRSSAEAQLKERIIQQRPESMADVYEECQNLIARKEAIALRRIQGGDMASYFHEPPPTEQVPEVDMAPQGPQLGEYSQLWQGAVYEPDDAVVFAETDSRVESGSMRKPNIGEALSGLTEFTQVMMPALMQQYQLSGDPTNMNILLQQLCQKTQMPTMQFPPLMMQPPAQEGPPDKKGKEAA